MLQTRKSLLVVSVLAITSSLGLRLALAQEDGPEQDQAEEVQRQRTRELMTARWKKLRAFERVAGKETEVDRVQEPIFSYSEPTRETGGVGTVWVWGTTGRPVALLSLSKAYGRPVWGVELVALEEGVSVVMHDGWRWSPESALKMTSLKDAQPPAESNVRRLSQMKRLVEQFKLWEEYRGDKFELRLLPRPVYRYQDEKAGLIDGALFNFAHGTNPEVLAVIECRKETSGPTWSYGFLPLAGARVTATLDGTTVWTKELTRESRAQEIYSTWLETEAE